MTTSTSSWHLARRAARMNPSVIREILKVTEKQGIISFGNLAEQLIPEIVEAHW